MTRTSFADMALFAFAAVAISLCAVQGFYELWTGRNRFVLTEPTSNRSPSVPSGIVTRLIGAALVVVSLTFLVILAGKLRGSLS